ncbi:hypothetical protein [uncultured Modestobacter sp.]|uniref:hypothetical protein n=1 Tax=uncultured Modestobacter sp. TaxID=380048 RepID=UPI00261C8157|nr:hypothetical protein [uncultured Modestobacter sp.]
MPDEVVNATPWPDGPRYMEWVGATGWRGWVLFKLRSADWYVDRLEEVGQRLGFDRYIGVEMALDGALAAISAAFDATVGAVIEAAEEFEDQAARDRGEAIPKRIEQHKYNWRHARGKLALATEIGVDTSKIVEAVNSALEEDPIGWLTRVRRLRNATIHNNTLARHIDVNVGQPTAQTVWGISVGNRGEDPVEYLRTARQAVELLVLPMLDACDHFAPLGMATSGAIHRDRPTPVILAPGNELETLATRLSD